MNLVDYLMTGGAIINIYTIFPMFLLVDEDVLSAKGKKNVYSMWRVVWESLGSCMLVTILLDFVRVGMTDVDFNSASMDLIGVYGGSPRATPLKFNFCNLKFNFST